MWGHRLGAQSASSDTAALGDHDSELTFGPPAACVFAEPLKTVLWGHEGLPGKRSPMYGSPGAKRVSKGARVLYLLLPRQS